MIQMTPGKKKKKGRCEELCEYAQILTASFFLFFFLYRYTTQRDLEEGDGQSYLQSLLLEWSWSSTFGVFFFFFYNSEHLAQGAFGYQGHVQSSG